MRSRTTRTTARTMDVIRDNNRDGAAQFSTWESRQLHWHFARRRSRFSVELPCYAGWGQSFGTCAQAIDNEKPLPTACSHSDHSSRVTACTQSDQQIYILIKQNLAGAAVHVKRPAARTKLSSRQQPSTQEKAKKCYVGTHITTLDNVHRRANWR